MRQLIIEILRLQIAINYLSKERKLFKESINKYDSLSVLDVLAIRQLKEYEQSYKKALSPDLNFSATPILVMGSTMGLIPKDWI